MAVSAATTLAVTLPLSGVAHADPTDPGTPTMPSQAQVDRAQADVAHKKLSVREVESALATANARLDQATTNAEIAFERYNGAQWRLQEARKATRAAQQRSRQAAEDVATQRAGIAQLVTESYQNGTDLNAASALLTDEGPEGLMNRYGVVQSAGDSMEASYDRYRAALAKAKTAADKAAKAEQRQESLAADARKAADAAGQAQAAAAAMAGQVAAQRQQLLAQLAKLQHISVALATKRHEALEEIAREEAAKKKAAAEAAAQAAQAKKDAQQTKNDQQSSGGSSSGGTSSAPPPTPNPAPNQSVAVQRAIAYAKAQLGKPYQWAASGPGSFDCSGLTMMAWARGGKSLPHYSVAQFYESTRVSMTDAKPGDLLFWSNNGSPSGIHHVALYLGDGEFIEAPHTGAYVRYNNVSNWYPDFVARP
jgi:cell wall-associated NlpC family hydrolase